MVSIVVETTVIVSVVNSAAGNTGLQIPVPDSYLNSFG